MLPARVWMPSAPNPSTEDIFSSALSTLFTDDTQNSHGIPGQSVFYNSPRYGKLHLGIPQHPDVEEGRKLFAHYLWNAGVVVADAVEVASNDDKEEAPGQGKVDWNQRYWDMRGKDVLELGAGTALPSLISALSHAHSTTITDHPQSPAIITDTIAQNVQRNLNINLLSPVTSSQRPPEPQSQDQEPRTSTQISIHGLTWGTPTFTSPSVNDKPSNPQPGKHSFDRIIIADCLWMPSQHANLVKTINDYLKLQDGESKDKNEKACALVIAGFHTGRSIVARFVEIATGSSSGRPDEGEAGEEEDELAKEVKGTLTAEELFEIDVDANVRPWLHVRGDEDRDQAKKWCICAVLTRRQ